MSTPGNSGQPRDEQGYSSYPNLRDQQVQSPCSCRLCGTRHPLGLIFVWKAIESTARHKLFNLAGDFHAGYELTSNDDDRVRIDALHERRPLIGRLDA